MPILISILLVCSVLSCPLLAAETSDSEPVIPVITYSASPEGFMSNSHILVGENEAVLIDAQFSAEEGRKVVELIKATGKQLSKILITHPHPDHYYGLEVLGVEFSDAEITGGPETIAGVRNTAKYWTGTEGEPRNFGDISILENKGFKHEDVDITYRIFRDGESTENTVFYIPSSQTLFVGDLASNGVHMWVGENRVEQWLQQLGEIRSIGPISTVYPGHGPVGGPDLLEQAEKYLLSFNESVKSSGTAEEAIKKINILYPDYKMPEILEGSVRAVMWSGDKGQ